MEIKDRLRIAVEYLKSHHELTNEQLSLALGYKTGNYVSEMIGVNKSVSSSFLDRLRMYYGINPMWVVEGNGDMLVEKNEYDSVDGKLSFIHSRRERKNQQKIYTAPLVPVKARAGYVSSYDQTDFLNTLEQYALPPGVDPRGAVWRYFEVDGDSMEPTFGVGDVLLASMVPHDDWQEIRNFYVYVIVTDSQVLVKRLYRKSELKWIMISDNESLYPQEILKVDMIKELWVFRRLIQNKAPVPKKFEIKL
ncbi:helix-turn-helix transcriptional regulator [Nostoc ellipsosporum NOK]|nr:helix-turn-helix transcriptional regulator [Nostoc ellipsosporum NOK]